MHWIKTITVWLLVVSLLLAGGACAWHGFKTDAGGLQRLYIAGAAEHVTDKEIIAALETYLGATYFELDIPAMRRAVLALPWVAAVRIEPQWPDGVLVRVREHQALARWRGRAVLARDGSLFRPPADELPANLPVLAGPEGSSDRLAEALHRFSQALAPMASDIARIELSARGAWTVTLANGLELRLGRDNIYRRARRFAVRGAPAVGEALATAGYVDLRYRHGFAVGGSRAATELASNKGSKGRRG